MRIGVCGIACQVCPRMLRGTCPSGERGCTPKENPFCQLATCAHQRGQPLCFQCPEFPCDTIREHGPVDYGYCRFLAEKEEATAGPAASTAR